MYAVDDNEIAVVNNLYENGKNIKSCLLARELENSLEGMLKALHKINETKYEGQYLELKDCPFPRTGGNAEAWAEEVKFYVQKNIDKFAAPLLYLKLTEAVRKTEACPVIREIVNYEVCENKKFVKTNSNFV